MDKIYPYIYHEHLLNVGKIYQDIYDIYLYIYRYTIHGWYQMHLVK